MIRHYPKKSNARNTATVVVTIALISVSPAFAASGSSSASAQLGPFSVELLPLAGNTDTFLTWALEYQVPTEGNASRSEVLAYSGDSSENQRPAVLWRGPFEGGLLSAETSAARADAEVTGSNTGAGSTFTVSGWATTEYSIGWFAAGVNDPYSGYGAWFTLSPHTELVISATAALSAQASGGDAQSSSPSHAYAQAWISVTGPSANGGGGSQSQTEFRYLDGYAYQGGPSYSESTAESLTIRFVNHTASNMDARFELGVYARGEAFAAAVPEPETWAMLLAGLGLVGWIARRHPYG